MRERELLNHIYARSQSLAKSDVSSGSVIVPPGDDCAAVRVGDDVLLLTVDQLIEGRHFLPDMPPVQIAHKAIARSVSDIAAMGGTPRYALATAALASDDARAVAIFDAMHDAAIAMGCPLVGGDIARSTSEKTQHAPAMFTVTVVGSPNTGRGPVLRSGARMGDGIYVTGEIGSSFSTGHHATFAPRVREATQLCDTLGESLHAMIDISDGLGIDAGRIAEASGVAMRIEAHAIPLRVHTQDPAEAVGDGEDYELIFTADVAAVVRAALDVRVTRIGTVIEPTKAHNVSVGSVLLDRADGSVLPIHNAGWDHGDTPPS